MLETAPGSPHRTRTDYIPHEEARRVLGICVPVGDLETT